MWTTGSFALAADEEPSGCRQPAPSVLVHCPDFKSNTPDHPNLSASVLYPLAATNFSNCATVTSCLSIQNGLSVTSCTGPSNENPSAVPILNVPPLIITISSSGWRAG